MTFSIKQIQQMMEIIKINQAVFIAGQIGFEYLSTDEKNLLKKIGLTDKTFKLGISDIDKSYYFGMMSFLLEEGDSYKTTEKEFDVWYKDKLKKKSKSISKDVGLKHLKDRAYVDLSGLGNKVSTKISNTILTVNQRERNKIKDKVKTKTIEAFEENKTQQWLASELKAITEDWARDFSRIANYTLQEAYGVGRAAQIQEDYGDEAEVYKQTFPGVCKHCLKNYGAPGEKPKIYKLEELKANGDNIGRPEQIPVVGPAHPWARSILHVIPKGAVWSDEQKRFVIVRDTKGVKRTSKVKITITKD
jgi:hypothetical protein